MKHLDRVLKWEKNDLIYPVMVDFDLTNKCNHHCPLCNSIQNRNDTTISFNNARNIISQLKEVDVKSIGFAGGGEPSCNPNLEGILKFMKQKDIESAIYTNGYELSDDVIEAIVDCCTWARISLDADTSELYKKTHGMGKEAFIQLTDNISKLVKIKNASKSSIVLGTCYLLGPNTIDGIYNTAKLSKSLGVDQIRFRPFLTLKSERTLLGKKSEKMFRNLEKCKELEDENFSVSYSQNRCESESIKGKLERNYSTCYIPNFFTSITADLRMYPCCFLKGKEEYYLGDLSKNSFKEIWKSEKREQVYKKINLKNCPNPCQFEKINELLWNIKNNELGGDMRIIDLLSSINGDIPHSNFL